MKAAARLVGKQSNPQASQNGSNTSVQSIDMTSLLILTCGSGAINGIRLLLDILVDFGSIFGLLLAWKAGLRSSHL